jgi:hypothetical protein
MIEPHAQTWAIDPLRRFERRPIFLTEDVEIAMALLVTAISASEPFTHLDDDRLEAIVESLVAEYDSASDLRPFGEGVEGITWFSFDGPPSVLIDQALTAPSLRRRRRMTIAHEIGHVVLHSQLFRRGARAEMQLFSDFEGPAPLYCLRESIELSTNWMEWQASFAGGALLMPAKQVHQFIAESNLKLGLPTAAEGTADAQVITAVSEHFDVSRRAAEVRLLQLRHIEPDRRIQPLPFS